MTTSKCHWCGEAMAWQAVDCGPFVDVVPVNLDGSSHLDSCEDRRSVGMWQRINAELIERMKGGGVPF